jgi:adenosylcobyric acid synthase
VLPYFSNLSLEAEDSVSLEAYRKKRSPFSPSTVNVAVVCFPHIANFTDFLPLSGVEAVTLNYVARPDEILGADVIILPGTKNTISDLCWLKQEGWEEVLHQVQERGSWVVGICGGYQMLGEEVCDPLRVEGKRTTERGLGFLPLRTVLAPEKTTRRVEVKWEVASEIGSFWGYEIHLGQTHLEEGVAPRFFVKSMEGEEWQPDGAVSRAEKVWGTYLHGLFESGPFLQAWLSQVGVERGIFVQVGWEDWRQERDSHLDRLAKAMEEHLDMVTLRALDGILSR